MVCCDGVGLLACPFSFGGGGLPLGELAIRFPRGVFCCVHADPILFQVKLSGATVEELLVNLFKKKGPIVMKMYLYNMIIICFCI